MAAAGRIELQVAHRAGAVAMLLLLAAAAVIYLDHTAGVLPWIAGGGATLGALGAAIAWLIQQRRGGDRREAIGALAFNIAMLAAATAYALLDA